VGETRGTSRGRLAIKKTLKASPAEESGRKKKNPGPTVSNSVEGRGGRMQSKGKTGRLTHGVRKH